MDRAQREMGSAALVLGSILVLVGFVSLRWLRFRSLWFDLDSCDVGLTIGFVKVIEKK